MSSKMLCRCVLLILLLLGVGFADSTTTAQDTSLQKNRASFRVLPPAGYLLEDPQYAAPPAFNVRKSLLLSVAIPGAGQVYCSKPVKGGLFLGAEIISGLLMANRYYSYRHFYTDRIFEKQGNINKLYLDLSMITDTAKIAGKLFDIAMASQDLNLMKTDKWAAKYTAYHATGWLCGIYVWNILDAVYSSNTGYDTEPRRPGKAAGLSAIPFLGLGQFYNHSYSKAGLIWTAQTMLVFLAYNNQQIMNKCVDYRNELYATKDQKLINEYIGTWNAKYETAFRKRNAYLWYFILFYFYGIFDAAVDAHLRDYNKKMQIQPVVNSSDKSIGLNMNMQF